MDQSITFTAVSIEERLPDLGTFCVVLIDSTAPTMAELWHGGWQLVTGQIIEKGVTHWLERDTEERKENPMVKQLNQIFEKYASPKYVIIGMGQQLPTCTASINALWDKLDKEETIIIRARPEFEILPELKTIERNPGGSKFIHGNNNPKHTKPWKR